MREEKRINEYTVYIHTCELCHKETESSFKEGMRICSLCSASICDNCHSYRSDIHMAFEFADEWEGSTPPLTHKGKNIYPNLPATVCKTCLERFKRELDQLEQMPQHFASAVVNHVENIKRAAQEEKS